MKCLMGAKFTMTATLLNINNDYSEPTTPEPNLPNEGGWVEMQDPITGEIVNQWKPLVFADNPTTPDEVEAVGDFPCIARGTSVNDRYGSNETYGENYFNQDVVRMWVPAHVRVKKSDRVTNIRKGGTVFWVDDDDKPTVFNVNGVTPQFNGPFNQHTETFLLLERVEA